jgi:hypothetical protein
MTDPRYSSFRPPPKGVVRQVCFQILMCVLPRTTVLSEDLAQAPSAMSALEVLQSLSYTTKGTVESSLVESTLRIQI